MELVDDFRGDDAHLIRSIEALIALSDAGALTPHGIGGHARALLSAAAVRLTPEPDQRGGEVGGNLCAKIFDHKWLDPECVETGCRSLQGRHLMARLYEVVHHDSECKAIGGNGDADCTCDAVPLLRELEKAWRLPIGTPSLASQPHPDIIGEVIGVVKELTRQLNFVRPRDGYHRAHLCTKALQRGDKLLSKIKGGRE